MENRAVVLQALRVKGRAAAADLAPVLGAAPERCAELLDELVAAGLCEEKPLQAVALTAAGRDEADAAVAEERRQVDQVALTRAYDQFSVLNERFKQLVTDWQLRDGSAINDHTDAVYDDAVVERLRQLHERLRPLLEELTGLVPRLAGYGPRFQGALDRIDQGDREWIARPMIDSYHTVWFELHEDLIRLLGRTRASEAAAGRAS